MEKGVTMAIVSTNGNPVAPTGPRTTADVVTPALVARLTRDVIGTGRTSTSTPLTGEPLAELPEFSPADVTAAFVRARDAQEDWAATPVAQRAAVLLRFHDLVLKAQEEILDLIQVETGKTRLHAHEEIQGALGTARHYGRRAAAYLKPRRHRGVVPMLTRVVEARRAKGVIGQIVPWNYPLALSVGDAVPAFAAGNAIVTKPDTQTALTVLWARERLVEAGLPRDVWQIVLGDGPVVGSAVIAEADHVTFTGSTATGRLVAKQAADRLVGVSLELGGKNALLVLEDAALDRAAEGAVRACFTSAGQLCESVERLYVHESVADAFLDRFLARTKALSLGSGLGYGAQIGSLAGARQLEAVTRHVDEAVSKGATVLAGGHHRSDVGPYFYEPTVLDGVQPSMAVYGEETFGPVVSVYRFADEGEALALANATPYGLNSSVWSRDTRRVGILAGRLRTGSVNVNEAYAAAYGSVQAPHGGMGDSGLGRRNGAEGILRYTEAQTVATQRLIPLGPSRGMDDASYTALMSRVLGAMKTLRLR
ncbi:succinic semialdehyde dehydrogenase [Streptomyces mirabilis]|uniref:succinic semialdehyde dehydrogenase n=1 Tax=Streptomyces mirabilis TaxID=68239 RepID=UPI0036A878AF